MIFKQVRGTRFTDKYLQARHQGTVGSRYSYTPHLPPRSPEKPSFSPPGSPPRTGLSSSPSRKVVSDFGTFSAPANASVFGTAVQSTPFSLAGGKAAFGGMRNGGAGVIADDDDDDDSGSRQRVELREDSITLDQVCFSKFCMFLWLKLDVLGKTYRDAECLEKYASIRNFSLTHLQVLYPV